MKTILCIPLYCIINILAAKVELDVSTEPSKKPSILQDEKLKIVFNGLRAQQLFGLFTAYPYNGKFHVIALYMIRSKH